MKLKVQIATIFAVLAIHAIGWAQSDDPETDKTNDLKAQFEELKSRSNNYQEYKVVKKVRLNVFWNSVADTLEANQSEISELKGSVKQLKAQVADLQNQVADRDQALEDREYKIEHMDFLGMSLTKGSYITFTWAFILVLFIAVIVLWIRFKSAHGVTRRTRQELGVVQSELEAHRKSARDKETKLRRDLQTEINRVEELKGKLGEE